MNYKQHCHPHCYLEGVPIETVGDSRLQGCAAMDSTCVTCKECKHSFNLHMHRTYDLVTVKRQFISEAVQRKIAEKRNATARMLAAKTVFNQLEREFKLEQKEVMRISATYGAYLKDVAIFPYNDALGDYLYMIIDQEDQKDNSIRDQTLIDNLRVSRRAYEEEKVK